MRLEHTFRRQVRDPYLLDGPSPGPFGSRQLVVGVGAGVWRGVQLVECINGEARGSQDPDPLAVAGVELYPVTGRLQTGNLALRVQQLVSGVSGHAGLAHGQQDAGGVEYQSPAWAKDPGCFGDPAGRVAPQASTALGDNQVETAGAERDVSGVSLQEREWEPEMFLAAAGGGELGWGEVQADGPCPAPGEPGGEVGGAAPQLDYIQAGDVSQHVELVVRDVEDPQVISLLAQARKACSSA
jgi:hypothetical protein